MLYWTLSKRTVTNLAVTLQLPVNDDGPDIGLITPKDHVWMNVLAGITIAMLVVGWTYMAMKYPVRLPQQTDWFAPKFISSGEKMAEVEPEGATYDDGTDTLLMKVNAKNTKYQSYHRQAVHHGDDYLRQWRPGRTSQGGSA